MKTYQIETGRTMELKTLDKYSVGMTTFVGDFKESYAIISKQDAKNLVKNLKEVK